MFSKKLILFVYIPIIVITTLFVTTYISNNTYADEFIIPQNVKYIEIRRDRDPDFEVIRIAEQSKIEHFFQSFKVNKDVGKSLEYKISLDTEQQPTPYLSLFIKTDNKAKGWGIWINENDYILFNEPHGEGDDFKASNKLKKWFIEKIENSTNNLNEIKSVYNFKRGS